MEFWQNKRTKLQIESALIYEYIPILYFAACQCYCYIDCLKRRCVIENPDMKKYGFITILAHFVLLLTAGKALAGPIFCANVAGAKTQCIFYSAKACREAVRGVTGAFCNINPEEIDLPNGPGLWCLVTSTRHTQCYYDNFSSCQKQIKTKNGMCVRSKKRPPVSKEFESDIEELL